MQATPQPHLKKGDVKSQPRGIYTTVPKSGGYGTNKFTLSERKGVKGVVRPQLCVCRIASWQESVIKAYMHWSTCSCMCIAVRLCADIDQLHQADEVGNL